MQIKIKCERCGVEKDLEIKVPKFCGNECRIANLKERMASKTEVVPEVVESVPLEATSDVTTEIPENINLESIQGNINENQTNDTPGTSV